jgi:plasmid replication initiation protein
MKVDDVVIPIRDIRDLLIANSNQPGENRITHWGNFKEEVEQCVAELKSYVVLRPSEDGIEENGETVNEPVSIFRDIDAVRDNQGAASYKFVVDPKMKGSLFALAHKYVTFQLLKDVRVKNKYACRLYPALKSRADSQKKYKDVPIFELSIADLRQLLVLGENKYSKSYDLKRYVVEEAIDDINANSDIRVWPTYVTKGRKLTGVRFNISVSKYNHSQLSLSIQEFIAFYPDQYPIIVEAATVSWKEYGKEAGDSYATISPSIIQDWVDGTVKTFILDFVKQELDLVGA